MSLETYIRAMPKAELDVQLEGAIPKNTLLMIADQNEIASSVKGFNKLKDALLNPDITRLTELFTFTSQWLRHPDDLSRCVYDVGVALSKQNTRYAELGLNLSLYSHMGLSFEDMMAALNDGADRARRGWKVDIAWVLNIPREEPRRGDEIARWAMSATGRKHNVVGLGLVGGEEVQPAGQFERPFRTAEKKGFPRAAQGGDTLGADGVQDTINELKPSRLLGGWGAAAPHILQLLNEHAIPLNLCMTRVVARRQVDSYADYPLRRLYDENIAISLTTITPTIHNITLTDEYLAAVNHCGLTVDELESIALNALRHSFMTDDARKARLDEFTSAYAQLRAEHLSDDAPAS